MTKIKKVSYLKKKLDHRGRIMEYYYGTYNSPSRFNEKSIIRSFKKLNENENEVANKIKRWYFKNRKRQMNLMERRFEKGREQNKYAKRRILIEERMQIDNWIRRLRNGEKIEGIDVPARVAIERMNFRKKEINKELFGNNYYDKLERNLYNENIGYNNMEEISFKDIDNSATDPMVLNSGIKNIKVNGKNIPFDIYKYKNKNKEVQNCWVVFWNKKLNAIGVKFVFPRKGLTWFPKKGKGTNQEPDFRKRNIFYLDILKDRKDAINLEEKLLAEKKGYGGSHAYYFKRDHIPGWWTLDDYDVRVSYDLNNRVLNKSKLFKSSDLNDESLNGKNIIEFGWQTPSGQYNPEFE